MALIKVVEVMGTSPESWDDAVRRTVAEATTTLRNVRGVDVVKQTAHVEDGRITEYRTTLHVAFVVEREGS